MPGPVSTDFWCWSAFQNFDWTLLGCIYMWSPKSLIFLKNNTDFFHFFFKKFIHFSWRLITLQYCSGFCHTLIWISHEFTGVPHPEPPSHFPPHPIPLGHPSAPAPSTLSHASNLDWRSVSHMVTYMFQCYSLRSSHSHLLPESKRLFYTSVSLFLSRI